jgi:hypothetical protein
MKLSQASLQSPRKIKSALPILMIATPLILSAFIHLWNPMGFPYLHGDEAHYLRRAMHVMQGLGPQETRAEFERPYDHPYFAQLFLAGVFWSIGYPHFIDTSDSLESLKSAVTQLYLYPRILMGILAVVDTFLIYKITERMYSKNAAFISSVLFAIMPLTWITRRVVLESIFLPFILLSILFVLYLCQRRPKTSDSARTNFFDTARTIDRHLSRGKILLILSGIFLGLAIFTKLTAIMMIPLLLYLIFVRSNESLKSRKLWFIPVVLIPLIWPTYALVSDQFQDWTSGVLWQTDRDGRGLYRSYLSTFNMDPLLSVLGLSSIILITAIKRDLFFILWLVPFLLFYSSIPFIQHFHWILLLPVLCMASGVCILELLKWISTKKNATLFKATLYCAIASLFIFGFASTVMLINLNLNVSLMGAQILVIESLPSQHQTGLDTKENVYLIGSDWMQSFSWIPKYIFNKDHSFKSYIEGNLPIKDEDRSKILLIVDPDDLEGFKVANQTGKSLEKERLYNNTHAIAEISEKSDYYEKYRDTYPFTSIHENRGIERGKIIIRANY